MKLLRLAIFGPLWLIVTVLGIVAVVVLFACFVADSALQRVLTGRWEPESWDRR